MRNEQSQSPRGIKLNHIRICMTKDYSRSCMRKPTRYFYISAEVRRLYFINPPHPPTKKKVDDSIFD